RRGKPGLVTVTREWSVRQVSVYDEPNPCYSKADSASSILVTRSTTKAQMRDDVSRLRLDRFRGVVTSRAIKVPAPFSKDANMPGSCAVPCYGVLGLSAGRHKVH